MTSDAVLAVVLDTQERLTKVECMAMIPPWCESWLHVTEPKQFEGFAALRNAAFALAGKTGMQWALMLDTDMRYTAHCGNLKRVLAATDADVIRLPERSKAYTGDRIFRLPLKGEFIGMTHEYYDPKGGRVESLDTPRFWELDKTPEQHKAKLERDRTLLEFDVTDDTLSGRAHYYLGDTLEQLGEHGLALRSFLECTMLSIWDEERAWAWYRIGVIRLDRGEYRAVINAVVYGMIEHGGIAELPWLASLAFYWLDDFKQALRWASIARRVALYTDTNEAWKREGFRYLPALYEAPYNVLHWSAVKLGLKTLEADYFNLYEKMLATRLQVEKG